MKTLDTPVLERLLDPIGRMLTPEVAEKLVKLRFDSKAQARISKLASKCNDIIARQHGGSDGPAF